MRSVIWGQLTKLISIGAKGALLLAVVPYMEPGEYSAYFSATTFALLIGRLCGFAAEEQIVLFVRSSKSRWMYFVSTGISFHLLMVMGILVVLVLKPAGTCAFCVLLALGLVTSCYLTGVLRISFPLAIEIAGGLPWTLVTAVALLSAPTHAAELMRLLCISYAASNTVLLFLICRGLEKVSLRPNFRALVYLVQRHRRWRAKLASNMLLAVNLRVVPIGIEFVKKSSALMDAVALAFSIGEVCYQLVMVRVNRSFTARILLAESFSKGDMLRELRFTAMTVAQCGAGLYLLSLTGLAPAIFGANASLNVLAAAYCGGVALFCFYRMHLWSGPQHRTDASALHFQVLLIVTAFLLLTIIDSLSLVIVLSTALTVCMFVVFSLQYIDGLGGVANKEKFGDNK